MSRREKGPTLATVMVQRAGLRGSVRALTWLICWGIASDELGRPVKMEEYAEYWGESLATAYREQQAFRKALPDAEVGAVWEQVRRRVDGSNLNRAGASAAILEAGSVRLA